MSNKEMLLNDCLKYEYAVISSSDDRNIFRDLYSLDFKVARNGNELIVVNARNLVSFNDILKGICGLYGVVLKDTKIENVNFSDDWSYYWADLISPLIARFYVKKRKNELLKELGFKADFVEPKFAYVMKG